VVKLLISEKRTVATWACPPSMVSPASRSF
jgi:hypothetical protein